MQVKTDPAGRLHDLLQAARNRPEGNKTRAVWASVFGVDESDTGEILKMLADLIDLAHEAKISLGRLDDIDHAVYLRPFKKIENALSHINLEANWKHWKDQLDDATLYGLQFGSDKLGRLLGYTEIEAEKISQILQDLEGLTSSVLDAELPDNVKSLLVGNLESLRRALIAYRIRGIEGLEQEIALSLGSILLHKEEIQSAPGEKSLWERYSKLLELLNRTVSFAKNAKELAGPTIAKLLGPDSGA